MDAETVWKRINRQGRYADKPIKYTEFTAWHQQEIANQLKALLDAHMIKPEYHNLVVGKWKELSDE